MHADRTERGFGIIRHDKYPPDGSQVRLVQMSSAIDPDYNDGLMNPGTSYLWVGDNHHLNRDEVAELVKHLQNWLDTGHL